MSLARTQMGVRPCVAFLRRELSTSSTQDPRRQPSSSSGTRQDISHSGTAVVEDAAIEARLVPQLDAREVAAVFTARLEAFLKIDIIEAANALSENNNNNKPLSGSLSAESSSPSAVRWYSGKWIKRNDQNWRMHNFYVASEHQPVAWADPLATKMTVERFRVFGMTARILVDAARIAFRQEPEFEYNLELGDEHVIGRFMKQGRLGDRPVKEQRGENRSAAADVNSGSDNDDDNDDHSPRLDRAAKL